MKKRGKRPKRRTFGSPTTPTFKLDLNRPSMGFVTGSSFFFGGMMILVRFESETCSEYGRTSLDDPSSDDQNISVSLTELKCPTTDFAVVLPIKSVL